MVVILLLSLEERGGGPSCDRNLLRNVLADSKANSLTSTEQASVSSYEQLTMKNAFSLVVTPSGYLFRRCWNMKS